MLVLISHLVLAHGTYSAAFQASEVGESAHLAVGTTFGLLTSRDDGGSWQWICDEAIGTAPGINPVWFTAPSGELLAGSFGGLYVSRNGGCTWEEHAYFDDLPDGGQGTGVADLRSNGTWLFAATGKYGVLNRVSRSNDLGVTWSPTPIASNGEFYTTVRFAPSRPQRVYVGAWWFRPQATQMLYWSDDFGDTFTRVEITNSMPIVPLGDGGMGRARGAFYVYDVDPHDPETLYAGLLQDDDPRHSFVIRSKDRGASWTVLLDSPDLLNAVVVSADGKTIWAATGAQVLRSTDEGATFAPMRRPTRYACVSRVEDRVYTCGWHEVDGFAVARVDDAGVSSPVLTWKRVSGVLNCPGSRVQQLCEPLFANLAATLPGLPGEGDDGGSGAGAGGGNGAGGGSQSPGENSCGCTLGGTALVQALLIAALVLATARRRSRSLR